MNPMEEMRVWAEAWVRRIDALIVRADALIERTDALLESLGEDEGGEE
jgi:hypothetical protein